MIPRYEYLLNIGEDVPDEPAPGLSDLQLREPLVSDASVLADLMLDAYIGTIDYHGETMEDAIAEVEAYFAGDRGGPPVLSVSRVAFAGAVLAGACLVKHWRERQCPLIGYVMTRAEWKKRGVGKLVLGNALRALRLQDLRNVRAMITKGNIASERLLGGLGFRRIDVRIRAYRDEDWPTVCAVHDRARPDELQGSCDARAFVPLEAEQGDAASFQRSQKFVACEEDRVVGFVGVDGNYLSWLYVDPKCYGRGIGRQLLRTGMQLIGAGAWTVSLAGNTRARKLYESEGFQVVREFMGSNAGYSCMAVELALSPDAARTARSDTI